MNKKLAVSLVLAFAPAALAAAPHEPLPADPAYVEHNGALYLVEKHWQEGGGRAVILYRPVGQAGGVALTPEQLRAHIAAQPPAILTPAAGAALAAAAPTDVLELVILLRNQPAAPIARELRALAQPQIDGLSEQVREITRRSLPNAPLTPAQERNFIPAPLPAADLARRRALSAQLDDLERDIRQMTFRQVQAAVAPDQDALAGFIAALGGEATARITSVSMVGLRLHAAAVPALLNHPLVARIDLDHPGEPELDNHKHSLGLVTGFWAAGITGGIHDVGVLDTGVAQNHPYLSSHKFLSNMGPNDTGSHGTGMAGILASTHPTNTGMAFGLDTIVVALAGSITTSMPGMDYIASTGEPENTNYSFGNGTANSSDYSPTDQFFDGTIATFGFMVSKSTGNGGFGSGAPTITHPAPAYNLMASANMDDFNNINRDIHRITSSSSRGPTLAGRKKPDITAPGTNSMSTHPSGGFANIGGTSSASPHTGGGIVLLYDMGATSIIAGKAILLNTTDAIDDNGTATTADDFWVQGSLWNRRYGWGYLHLGKAYLHGLDFFLGQLADKPGGDYRLYTGHMFPKEKATLVWQRHVAYNGATFPNKIESLSDLDLFAYAEPTGQSLASSTSPIDNVEQLHVEQDGPVVLRVKAAGPFDPDVAAETFALATQENFKAASGPAFTPIIAHPAQLAPGQPFTIEVDVQNSGDLGAHAVLAELSGVTILAGPNPASLGSIAAGAAAKASWQVQASAQPGQHPVNVAISSKSYGEEFTGAGNSSFGVGGCYADCDGNGQLTIDDFICFQLAFAAGSAYADCDGSGTLNIEDFICYQLAFALGC